MIARVEVQDIEVINNIVVMACTELMGLLTHGGRDNYKRFTDSFRFTLTGGKNCYGGFGRGFGTHSYGRLSLHHDRERCIEKRKKMYVGKSSVWIEAKRQAKKNNWLHVEYATFHNDLEIGGFISDDAYSHVLAVCCHEVAHAADQYNDLKRDDRTSRSHTAQIFNMYTAGCGSILT